MVIGRFNPGTPIHRAPAARAENFDDDWWAEAYEGINKEDNKFLAWTAAVGAVTVGAAALLKHAIGLPMPITGVAGAAVWWFGGRALFDTY